MKTSLSALAIPTTQSLELTEAEVREITRLKQPAAQARFFSRLGVSFQRRGDGSLLINRLRYNMERAGLTDDVSASDDGPRWGTH